MEKAKEKKLDIIAICDHNSAENVEAAMAVGLKTGITVLPGMEVQSVEEVHIIALFKNLNSVISLQDTVFSNISSEKNDAGFFGEQIIANEFDEVEGYNTKLLIGATQLSLDRVVNRIHELEGLAIAAHVNRETYSIIGQLGFIPENLNLDALEISSNINLETAIKKFPEIEGFPVVTSSDAHYLHDIGKAYTTFMIEKPALDEIKLALEKKGGRDLKIEVQK